MKRRTKWLLKAAVSAALGISVGSVTWWLLWGHEHPRHAQSTPENASSQPCVPTTTGVAAGTNPPPVPFVIGAIVEKERKRVSTAEDIIRKGLPLISTGRKDAVDVTGGRSLQELADNLGDINVMDLCRNRDVWGVGSGMPFWSSALPPNTMILRLIEEGRQDPDRVSDILEKTIARKIEQLAEIRKKQLAPKNPAGPVYDVFREALPTQFSIAGGFYVLANIGRLNDPALLEKWVAAPKPAGYEAVEMGTWLIDYYFRLADGSKSPSAAAHLAIANDRVLAGPRKVFSKWNQPWDVRDRMLTITGVNTKDLQTIEVLSIPSNDALTFKETIEIQENFFQHVRQMRSTDATTPKGP